MGEKLALIIATSQYKDTALRQLIAPAQDAESLARVLESPAIGGFQVRILVNEPSSKVNLEIEDFCDNRNRDDLLVVYFSGHGIKDSDGQLYFATIDTQLVRHNVRRATAVAASFVNQVMSRCRSRRQILLLDCCYSGAFKEGMLTKAGKAVGVGEQLEGQGRVVLTASDALQYSFEGEHVQGEGVRSVFTRTLAHGLETGEADLDRDGVYSLDEVYDYVYVQVSDVQPEQRPMKMGYVEGKIFLGNNPRPRPAELPSELQDSLLDSRPWVRKGAQQELARLLSGNNQGLSLAARDALTTLAKADDSFEIREMAEECLLAYPEGLFPDRQQPSATAKASDVRKQPERDIATGVTQKQCQPLQKGSWNKQSPGVTPLAIFRGTGPLPISVNSIAFATPQLGWAVCDGGIILHTVNGGTRWKKQKSGTSTILNCVAFATPHVGWAVGWEGTILHTVDGGATWKKQKSDTRDKLLSVACATPLECWAVGSRGTILRTLNGGASWIQQNSGTDQHLYSVVFATRQAGWAVGFQGIILHTVNGGASWIQQNSGTSATLNCVAFATAHVGWAVGWEGTILHTVDGGATWKKQKSDARDKLSSVACVTSLECWAVGWEGTILHTVDGGTTWKEQDSGTNELLFSVAFATPQVGCAVGTRGTILQWASQSDSQSGLTK
jgi:photosystem II stability/assembly factor-like uncharacterized protein